MSSYLAAAIQMTSTPDVAANLSTAAKLIGKAAVDGASLVVLPENFAFMGHKDTDKLAHAEIDGSGPIQDFLSNIARQHRIWLIGGTIPIQASPGKVFASSLVFDDKGVRVGRYDKIHLFDVDVPGGSESYRESATIDPGSAPLAIDTPFGKLGVTICYDVRFPELYRRLADAKVEIIVVPSAFTASTGAAHWRLLTCARAVENLAYVIAPNQGGLHPNGRQTFGHSLIADPWGSVLAELELESGIALAKIDLNALHARRAAFPALQHRRILAAAS